MIFFIITQKICEQNFNLIIVSLDKAENLIEDVAQFLTKYNRSFVSFMPIFTRFDWPKTIALYRIVENFS